MMDWFPIVFVTFKVIVLGTCMFFAVKWHYDQGKMGKKTDVRVVLRTGGMAAAGFVLALSVLMFATFAFARKLGMDLPFP